VLLNAVIAIYQYKYKKRRKSTYSYEFKRTKEASGTE
jgi:hypothetical protein